MAEDKESKTEEPTGKRIEDARKDGNVPKSGDVAAWVGMLVAIPTIIFLFGFASEHVQRLFNFYVSLIGKPLTRELIFEIVILTMKHFLIAVLPIIAVIMVAGIIGNVAQFGFNFTSKPLQFKLDKLNPISGLKNLISVTKIVEGLKIMLKSFTAFGVGYYYFLGYIKELPTVSLFSLGDQIEWLVEKAVQIALIMLGVFFVFAAIDLFWTRYQYFKNLRMTKQEVKDEFKNMEGNPEIKGKIRSLQFQMFKKRMMSSVPQASVVVTNPTHYAVAIKYKAEDGDLAPKVVASGVDNIALKIKEIALANNIPIVENPPLARELYAKVKPDEFIPDTLYQAVAEVLVYVMRLNSKK
ncbi:MAG TPA: flagellar biosynthesis protein FlhB [Campylobacterales bacterium]|nr:flagellar biosynthesis protein FlhB [Campylobacterales bacterium]